MNTVLDRTDYITVLQTQHKTIVHKDLEVFCQQKERIVSIFCVSFMICSNSVKISTTNGDGHFFSHPVFQFKFE